MTISKVYRQALSSLSRSGNKVTELFGKTIYQGLNALYETVWDKAAPPVTGVTPSLIGHDHTPLGGGAPINRGLVWSEQGGNQPCYDLEFQSGNETRSLSNPFDSTPQEGRRNRPVCFLISPGFNSNGVLEVALCYTAENSDLVFGVAGTEYELESTSTPTWVFFDVSLAGFLQAFNPFFTFPYFPDVYVRCGNYEEDAKPRFKLYAWTVEETHRTVSGLPGDVPEFSTQELGDVYSGHVALADELVEDDQFVDADTLFRAQAMANAIFEGTEGVRAVGATGQVVKGHNHDESTDGGRLLSRGVVYVGSNGNNEVQNIASQASGVNTYQTMLHFRPGPWFSAWISPGLDNQNTVLAGQSASAPYLSAYMHVERVAFMGVTTDANVFFKVVNESNNKFSEIELSSVPMGFNSWVRIDGIPANGGAINAFDLEMKSNVAANFLIGSFVLFEEAGGGAAFPHPTKSKIGGFAP